MPRGVFIWMSLLLVSACSTNQADYDLPGHPTPTAVPKRIEFSRDTSFSFWDSLLLQYSYRPVRRTLTAFDKEWYVFHDAAERRCGYINMKGDTVIPMKYGYIPYVTDTFRHFAWVWLPDRGLVAINKNEEVLFEPHYFDNAPDEDIVEGLMRIERCNKVGFANAKGEVMIEPVYDVAGHFENGYARVGFNCYLELLNEEHNPTFCRQNGVIDKTGKLLFISSNSDSVNKVYRQLVQDD